MHNNFQFVSVNSHTFKQCLSKTKCITFTSGKSYYKSEAHFLNELSLEGMYSLKYKIWSIYIFNNFHSFKSLQYSFYKIFTRNKRHNLEIFISSL